MMKSRAAGALVFFTNLAAFGAFACVAFARNIHALFYHYDGTYMLVDARDQLNYGQLTFAFSNNFLQSVGNIQLSQSTKLLFFLWPIGWFSDLRAEKIAAYVILAMIVFTAAYALARLLLQSQRVAAAAGWILGFVSTPFVPVPFFYPILNVAPNCVVIVAAPVVAFWLMSRAGRSPHLVANAVIALGLVALVFYLLAAAPLILPILALGMLPYVMLALMLARDRSELLRRLAVLAVVIVVTVVLRWPWYVLGLFLDSAPNLFPNDFTVVYHDISYASLLFQGKLDGRAGPLFAWSAVVGILLSLKAPGIELRTAARTLLVVVATLLAAGLVLVSTWHWILPPPIYIEVAMWPFYAVFAAIAALSIFNFIAERVLRMKSGWTRPRWVVPALLMLAAAMVLSRRPTASGYPFPPRITPVVAILKADIATDFASAFKGRLLTAVPVRPDGGDAWAQQSRVGTVWALSEGNDEMSVGLWYYRIPTLFEYNQFISPAFHALIKRALQRPPLVHQRNITVLTYPDARILKLLGVRYVLMPRPDAALGELRATEDRAGEPWGLVELAAPNLATYSPTAVEVHSDLASTLDFVTDDRVDLTRQATARESVAGPLVPVRSSTLGVEGRDLHVTAESEGRTLVVVPVEFSHCLELHEARSGAGGSAALLRIDGLLTGIVFDRHVDAVLSFRIGPLHNQLCRWEDYREIKAMLR